jgi:F0F1-type ATP synthase alpha subunit
MILFLLTNKYFSAINVEKVQSASQEFISFIEEQHNDITKELNETKVVSDELTEKLKAAADEFFKNFT